MTEAIISGLSSSDVIFGGDLHFVVALFDPIINKYNRANYESLVLVTNMFNISNILVDSTDAWQDLPDFGERYLLSTSILANVDDMGFLFLSENPFVKGPKRFSFSHIGVVLEAHKAPNRQDFPDCYDFPQVIVDRDCIGKMIIKFVIILQSIAITTGVNMHSERSL